MPSSICFKLPQTHILLGFSFSLALLPSFFVFFSSLSKYISLLFFVLVVILFLHLFHFGLNCFFSFSSLAHVPHMMSRCMYLMHACIIPTFALAQNREIRISPQCMKHKSRPEIKDSYITLKTHILFKDYSSLRTLSDFFENVRTSLKYFIWIDGFVTLYKILEKFQNLT